MDSIKYIGLDAHQSTISVAVLNAQGKLAFMGDKAAGDQPDVAPRHAGRGPCGSCTC